MIVPMTSGLTGLDQSVLQIKTKIVSWHTPDSKPIKQEVNSTVILRPGQTLQLITNICKLRLHKVLQNLAQDNPHRDAKDCLDMGKLKLAEGIKWSHDIQHNGTQPNDTRHYQKIRRSYNNKAWTGPRAVNSSLYCIHVTKVNYASRCIIYA